MTIARLLLATLVLAGAAGCGDDTPTTPTQPAPPPTVTEEFTDTLTVNGGRTHAFNTAASGEVRLTIAELTPNSTAEIGISLGTWNGSSCQIVIARDSATQGAEVIGSAGGAGNYCARVYDAGRLQSATGYRITVVHR
jgi:hypothetical protein